MNKTELMLIDISGLAHQTFHVSGSEPDPNFISTKLIDRVRAITSQHAHAAICCDNGKSFRHEIDPNYKAGRDTENRAVLYHQLGLALDVLRKDGFPVWSVKGFEADDLAATATRQALDIDPDVTVVIVSDDKDLAALISDRVTQRKFDGSLRTPADVFDKFGVKPEQIPDLLALMGDSSDNIKGAEKIGKVIGARLLSEHGTLAALFEKMEHGMVSGVTPAMRTNLLEFKARWPTVAALIKLRTDAEIPFAEIAAERTAAPMTEDKTLSEMSDAEFATFEEAAPVEHRNATPPTERELDQNESLAAMNQATRAVSERITSTQTGGSQQPQNGPAPVQVSTSGPMPVRQETLPVPYAAPVDFSQQLEPRSMEEAKALAKYAFESRLFSGFGTPQAVLMAVLAGRELGISAMASLRSIHVIENKPCLSADIMRAVVLKSGLAEYFRCVETTPERATFETRRKGEPSSMSLTFTMADATTAGVVKKGSGWEKFPSDMLRARASAKLCRLTYPDVIAGLYDPSEL